ncbi:hypothetical protein BDV95DRAFT_63076 [Massariosphaeria phaeospora]|uniref:Secreted protein n=1 Tax=Massariosphaeria phaeospora TaxID=100035 RepID=A0A7C8M4X9_9PLEO|nr:hypothetical protein BDV95DRAFT_63076 [Massariosphaeria phaeospora]
MAIGRRVVLFIHLSVVQSFSSNSAQHHGQCMIQRLQKPFPFDAVTPRTIPISLTIDCFIHIPSPFRQAFLTLLRYEYNEFPHRPVFVEAIPHLSNEGVSCAATLRRHQRCTPATYGWPYQCG